MRHTAALGAAVAIVAAPLAHAVEIEVTVTGTVEFNQIAPVAECLADIGDPPDDAVTVVDLLALLASWGSCPAPCPPSCAADINGDCRVDVLDLLALLAAWGPC